MVCSTSIGLDVHARSIGASALIHETGEMVRASFDYDAASVPKWAESLPQPAGDRVKTDRRDADFLTRMLAVGNVVECWCPTTSQEADRDLSRLREHVREDLMRARHQLSKFLLRKGHVDAEISRRAASPELSPVVTSLSGIRGVSTLTAFAVECGDLLRFRDARAFMSFVGPVPSESSSGESTSRGRSPRPGTRTSGGSSSRQPGTTRGRSMPHRARRPGPSCADLVARGDVREVQPKAEQALPRPEGQEEARLRDRHRRGPRASGVRLGDRFEDPVARAVGIAGHGTELALAAAIRPPAADGPWGDPRLDYATLGNDARMPGDLRAEATPSRRVGMRYPTRECQTRKRASLGPCQRRRRRREGVVRTKKIVTAIATGSKDKKTGQPNIVVDLR